MAKLSKSEIDALTEKLYKEVNSVSDEEKEKIKELSNEANDLKIQLERKILGFQTYLNMVGYKISFFTVSRGAIIKDNRIWVSKQEIRQEIVIQGIDTTDVNELINKVKKTWQNSE